MNLTDNLTEHFKASEVACPCCEKFTVSMKLMNALEELRSKTGPLKVLSGYRCTSHNASIRGERNSQHCIGNAADLELPAGLSLEAFYHLADSVPDFALGGVGTYEAGQGQGTSFLHVDVRGKRARWARVNGAYVACPFDSKP